MARLSPRMSRFSGGDKGWDGDIHASVLSVAALGAMSFLLCQVRMGMSVFSERDLIFKKEFFATEL